MILFPVLILILQLNMKHDNIIYTFIEIESISRNIAISIYFAWLCSINNIYISCIIQALLLAGDIETNPGPYCERDLFVSHINAQSIVHKLDFIAVELGDFDITVSETWLDQSISSSTITIPGYQEPIRHDRNRHGGRRCYVLQKFCSLYRENRSHVTKR